MEPAAARDDVLTGLDLVGAADVAEAGHSGRQRRQLADALRAGRQRFEQLVGDDGLAPDVRDVDHRARARYGDGFLEAADAHLAFDVGREPGGQANALTDDRREPVEGEGDAVLARTQLGDDVAALRRPLSRHVLSQ